MFLRKRKIAILINEGYNPITMDLYNKTNQAWKKSKYEFVPNLSNWADALNSRLASIKDAAKLVRSRKALRLYLSVSRIKQKGPLRFSIRFLGQEVGELKVEGGNKYLCIDKDTARNNKSFHFSKIIIKAPWVVSKDAKLFRSNFNKLFRDPKYKKKIGIEHMIESLMIREMEQGTRSKLGGLFPKGIKPILIAKRFPFQMPVPLSANKGLPKKSNRGHIDILARRRTNKVIISVWEIKKPGVNLKNVIPQVYIYALTLLFILQTKKIGQDWYNIFGFSGKKPSIFELEAVAVVSDEQRKTLNHYFNQNISRMKLNIGKNKINFYAMFYKDNPLSFNAFEKLPLCTS